MSFKRDGDDLSLLKNLQHRRVSEILGDNIPDDEAALLSNGRLTCTVCTRRPIFDTIQILAIHRKGKKHLLELSNHLQHKRDLEMRMLKQKQKLFIKTGKVMESEKKVVSLQSPKNMKSGLGKRKFSLDITVNCEKINKSLKESQPSLRSANSQVRQYLKSLSRKRPLEKTVNRMRECYGVAEEKDRDKDGASGSHSKTVERSTETEHDLKLLESGWVRDGNGRWSKDPNVEFDSDEEEPMQ